VLVMSGLLIAITITLAVVGRSTDVGTVRMPEASVVDQRDLRFLDGEDGSVLAVDAATETTIHRFAPGGHGFLRGVLRGLARDRRLEGIGSEPAFRLTRWSDGRLSIRDLATGRETELDAFGPTNVQNFAQLLDPTVALEVSP
jgi:putative photosynthetic complex assembly protein